MQGPDEVRIETPEQIELALEPAGLGSRFVAYVVDALVWIGLLIGLAILAVLAAALLGLTPSGEWTSNLLLGLLGVVVYLILLGYDIVFELRWNGQTPGKRFAGIRVLREGGAPIDFRSSCLRNLLRPVDSLPLAYLLGALLVLVTSRRQRLGDMAAGTIVIRERALAAPADLDKVIARLATDEFAFTPEHVAACSPGDRHILRSYFLRCESLDDRARHKLARRLARLFCAKTGYEPDWPLRDPDLCENFLASLYRDLHNWARHGRK
jgi:uncharacterized RDD family membrane protein YckC